MKSQSEETKIAVLAEKMEAMTHAFEKMETKLDNLAAHFVTQDQLTVTSQGLRESINRLEKIVYGVLTFIALEIGGLVFMAIQNFIFK